MLDGDRWIGGKGGGEVEGACRIDGHSLFRGDGFPADLSRRRHPILTCWGGKQGDGLGCGAAAHARSMTRRAMLPPLAAVFAWVVLLWYYSHAALFLPRWCSAGKVAASCPQNTHPIS